MGDNAAVSKVAKVLMAEVFAEVEREAALEDLLARVRQEVQKIPGIVPTAYPYPEAAAQMGLTVRALERQVGAGLLHSCAVGGVKYITVSEIQHFLGRQGAES